MNRGRILETILVRRDWTRQRSEDIADFALWDTYRTSPRPGRLQLFDRSATRAVGSKRSLYRHLRRGACLDLVPRTWLSLAEVRRDAPGAGTGLWFLKHSTRTFGGGMQCFRDVDALARFTEDVDMRYHLVQQGVASPCLLEGHKFNLRVYVVIVEGPDAFLFDDGVLSKRALPYEPLASDRNVHICASRRYCDKVRFSEWHGYATVRPRIARSLTRVLACFSDAFKASGRFQILGADFVVDESLWPWLLEVNTYPNLDTHRAVSTELAEAFYDLAIAPRVSGTEPAAASFIPLV
jgi:Tubulin-tyrosine ligase family